MCGIFGYCGAKAASEILIEGLKRLEYRGYDSSGICVGEKEGLTIIKRVGKIKVLADALPQAPFGKNGIAHTRWATHGGVTEENAHPHTDCTGKLALVHNGIIENYQQLKEKLQEKGHVFKSQTDSEVIAHLIEENFDGDLPRAVKKTLPLLKGTYGLIVMHADCPDMLVGARNGSPLILGIGNHEMFLASDVNAMVAYTKQVVYLNDREIVTVTPEGFTTNDVEDHLIQKDISTVDFQTDSFDKQGYPHFMLKEIHEQPDVIRNVLSGKLPDITKPIVLDEVKLTKEQIKNLKRIEIIACGTSLHAAMVAKYILEAFTNIPVDVEPSSEYIYRKTVTDANTLVIGISQSGETSDTITAIRQAKAVGSHVLIITNRPDSIMAREADSLIPVNAGIEVSVAATKSFNAQLIALYLFSMYVAEIKESFDSAKIEQLKHEMMMLPQKIETILSHEESIIKCARAFASYKNFIYIARGINYPTALEGALKLKEISYINATGYPAGELKHGPIAMLDETMPVLAILMPGSIVYEKVLSNAEEAKARNARMIALTSAQDPHLDDVFEYILKVPSVDEYLSPVIASVPLQLLAYYIAEFLGKDVDQPRNLAKSVTVE